MTIKQPIPVGHSAARCSVITLRYTTIPFEVIVTDWVWRNRHAEPVCTPVIHDDYVPRDLMIATYYERLGLRY